VGRCAARSNPKVNFEIATPPERSPAARDDTYFGNFIEILRKLKASFCTWMARAFIHHSTVITAPLFCRGSGYAVGLAELAHRITHLDQRLAHRLARVAQVFTGALYGLERLLGIGDRPTGVKTGVSG
jgi:hypothetical protein